MAPARKRQRLSTGDVEAESPTTGDSVEAEVKAQEHKAEQQRRSLFVRSLPATTTTESLTALFSESYPIKHATAVIDPETKQCRGYGFVTFADEEDAKRAREELNNHVLDGRKIRIEIAEPRHRNADKESTAEVAKARKAKAEKEAQNQAPRLIVRNLPWTIKTPEQLSKLFLSYGKVKQAYLPKKSSGTLAGFGFVVLRGRKNAEKALAGVNGKEVEGRTLAVDWAVSKEVYSGLLKEESSKGEEKEVAGEADMDDAVVNGAEDEASASGGDDEDIDIDDDDLVDDEDDDPADSDDDDVDDNDDDDDADEADNQLRPDDKSSTLFIRNLPFVCSDEDLEDHFSQFGSVRYARVVVDGDTGRSRGVGFVAFYDKAAADTCVKEAPRREIPAEGESSKDKQAAQTKTSILQNEDSDPSGRYTLDGRVLQVARAVEKSEANRLTEQGVAQRHKRNEDKRRLYLLSEGTISTKSELYEKLSPSERTMREASAKQRKTLIQSNPSLHLSLTRLSVRNLPRSIDSKALKALAREAVVGFAADVKAGTRQKLSKEEVNRGGDEMRAAELARKQSGKGVVRQTKVVFEGASGGKVSEDSGAGRSRGYGFIEYHTHRSALMGLRWLNGHAVGYSVQDGQQGKHSREDAQDRKKRIIVEFAIENAQVVKRRQESEAKARERSRAVQSGLVGKGQGRTDNAESRKRKREEERGPRRADGSFSRPARTDRPAEKEDRATAEEKLKKRNQIIGRKRALRRQRKG